MKGYYYILGVSRTASAEEIKYAYKKLSIKFHPDKNDGDKFFEDRFKEIQEAYDTLKDNFKKSHYDFNLKKGTQSFSNQEKQQPSDSDYRKSSPKILFFNIAPDKVTSGSEITISWAVENAKVISITGLGLVESMGKRVVRIHNKLNVETKTITLYAENDPETKVSKDISVKFEKPIPNPIRKSSDVNVSTINLILARLRNNKYTKVLVSFSVIVILYNIYDYTDIPNGKENSDILAISVPKIKDSFYYSVSESERKKNPKITDVEVAQKVNIYRQNPEEYYAQTYFEYSGGKKINRKILEKIAKMDNLELDFNIIPNHLKEINITSYGTGEKPFSDCFEKMIQCYNNCSQIVVIAPINSDVVVTVKQGDQVIDHTFISNAETFTFELENGTYQTFFYFGSGGWDVDKILTTTSCGELYGGFVTDEVFSKAQEENLNSTILTYTLQLTKNGNFQTSPSTVDENF